VLERLDEEWRKTNQTMVRLTWTIAAMTFISVIFVVPSAGGLVDRDSQIVFSPGCSGTTT
jgi:hypothetical protein